MFCIAFNLKFEFESFKVSCPLRCKAKDDETRVKTVLQVLLAKLHPMRMRMINFTIISKANTIMMSIIFVQASLDEDAQDLLLLCQRHPRPAETKGD